MYSYLFLFVLLNATRVNVTNQKNQKICEFLIYDMLNESITSTFSLNKCIEGFKKLKYIYILAPISLTKRSRFKVYMWH